MSQCIEYRVRWQREGHGVVTRIYQTEAAARRKAEGILALEEVKGDTRFEDMADLVAPPTIEMRHVGIWQPAPEQPREPSDAVRDSMKAWAGPVEYEGVF